MKIAYLLEIDPYHNSGIVKKINDQVSFWKSEGHDVEVFNIWPANSTIFEVYLNATLFSNKFVNKLLGESFVKTYATKTLAAKKVKNAIKKFAPDLIYFRQNICYPGLLSILEVQTSIMELNTVDDFEMEFYSKLKKRVYFLGKQKTLNKAKALVAVSPSILEHYTTFNGLQTVVSNGINLAAIPQRTVVIDESPIKLIFVGSNNMPWHGLSTIFELARLLPQCEFHIAGYIKEDFPEIALQNVIFHGWVNKTRLTTLYKECHFGIGSFGNHLVGKPTDSTLKVREYLAYGLPVILGHNDVDFETSPFVKKVTNDAHQLIDISEIKQFLNKHKNRIVQQKDITVISSETKETARLTFFKDVIKTAKK